MSEITRKKNTGEPGNGGEFGHHAKSNSSTDLGGMNQELGSDSNDWGSVENVPAKIAAAEIEDAARATADLDAQTVSPITRDDDGSTTTMKPVPTSNSDKVDAAIRAVEGPRVSARTLDHGDVDTAVRQAERALSVIPKKLWQGTKVLIAPHRVPYSYDYNAMATEAHLVRRSADWALVEVRRERASSASYGGNRSLATRITLPGISDTDLLGHLLRSAGLHRAIEKDS